MLRSTTPQVRRGVVLVRSLLPVKVLLSSLLAAEGKLAFLGPDQSVEKVQSFHWTHNIAGQRYVRDRGSRNEGRARIHPVSRAKTRPPQNHTWLYRGFIIFLLCFHCDIYKMTVHWCRPYKTAGMYSTIQKSRRLCSTSRFA